MAAPGRPALAREPRGGDVHADDGAGLAVGHDGIHDDDVVGTRPQVEQRGRVVGHDDLDAVRREGAHAVCDVDAHGVVAAVGVPEADHQAGHGRSTVRSRKCVAHEMHGS